MFERRKNRSTFGTIFNLAELTFHATARKVRQGHGNALMSIFMSVMQSLLFLLAFYVMFTIFGQRGAALRGDFTLYLVTGIFAYLTHIQAVRSMMGAETSTSAMMQHGPMNTLVAIIAAALSTLYVKLISLGVILFVVHVLVTPLDIAYWPGGLAMFILAWASGCAVGLVFMAANPWSPDVVQMLQLIYIRANMIASGKMFVANMMPSAIIAFFDWNPLFHIIDQARGFVFQNYFPHHSNWEYPLYATLVLVMIGMMGEFYTRKHASASWDAAR